MKTKWQSSKPLKQNILYGFELLGLAIHPNFKRQGVGTQLLADCISCSHEYHAIDAAVFIDNRPMLLLLIKHGFIPVKMKNEYRYDGVDTVLLKYYKEKKSYGINPAIKYNNIFYNKPTAGMLLFGQDSFLNNCRVNSYHKA